MPVYWSMLIVTLVCHVMNHLTISNNDCSGISLRSNTNRGIIVFSFAYIVFFCGLRDSVLDTYWYVGAYKVMPVGWQQTIEYIKWQSSSKGYFLLEGLFKNLITDNYYIWLSFLAGLCCFCLFRIWYRHSADFTFSVFLFVASTSFTWLINGVRQFIVVCVLFGFSDWLFSNKKVYYCVLALLLSSIHITALVIIPITLFVSSKRILGWKMLFLVGVTVLGLYYSSSVFRFISIIMDRDYTSAIETGTGSNIIRLFVTAIPMLFVLLGRRRVEDEADAAMVVSINMSFVGVCFSFASTFTNGILVGRMPIYFTVYNLMLLPWLIKTVFTEQSAKLVRIACVLLYGVYFYYQMMVAWNGLPYVSEILNLNFQ